MGGRPGRPARRTVGTRGLLLAGGVMGLALLLLLNGLVVSRTVQGMQSQEQRVTQTQRVLIALGQLRATFEGAQIGVSSYVLTDAPDDLQMYRQARPRLDGELMQMRTLIAASADSGGQQYVTAQQQRLASLQQLVPTEYAAWQNMVELEDTGHHSAALQVLSAGASQHILASIQQVLDQVRNAAQFVAEQQMRLADAAVRDAPHTLLLLAAGDLVLLLIVLALLWRVIVLRERLARERAQAEALTQIRALQEANRRMETFISIASHELKTPLTSLKANLQLILRRLQHAEQSLPQPGILTAAQTDSPHDTDNSSTASASHFPDVTPLMKRALFSTDRLVRLTDDLLDLGRIQADRLAFNYHLLNLAALLRDCVEEHLLGHPERTITLTALSQPVMVLADEDRLQQVVANYLTNALKFSQPEQPVHVRLTVMTEERQARVSVQDFGPGLSVEEQARVWERFYRAPGIEHRSGSSEGLGIGLSISKTIIERHGGYVGVESAVGQGATFWFTLPLADNGA